MFSLPLLILSSLLSLGRPHEPSFTAAAAIYHAKGGLRPEASPPSYPSVRIRCPAKTTGPTTTAIVDRIQRPPPPPPAAFVADINEIKLIVVFAVLVFVAWRPSLTRSGQRV